jgi:hypothetical protein
MICAVFRENEVNPWLRAQTDAFVHGTRGTAKGKFISYLRVSTDKQGRSGLGLEAQRQAVTRYLNGCNWTVAAECVETESGKRNDRPKLAAALRHAKAIGATVVFRPHHSRCLWRGSHRYCSLGDLECQNIG